MKELFFLNFIIIHLLTVIIITHITNFNYITKAIVALNYLINIKVVVKLKVIKFKVFITRVQTIVQMELRNTINDLNLFAIIMLSRKDYCSKNINCLKIIKEEDQFLVKNEAISLVKKN
jgi:hypothetical protein